MISIYICDDNAYELHLFSNYVKKILLMEEHDFDLVLATTSPRELLLTAKEDPNPALFFLDIELNSEVDGLELGKSLRQMNPTCFLVYVTSHSELVFHTFHYKLEVLDFILKDKPQEIFSRMQECIQQVWVKYQQSQRRGLKTFSIKTGTYIKLIPLYEICYIETIKEDPHYLYVHLLQSTLRYAGLLKHAEMQLDETFFRCHKSYYINLNMIESVDFNQNTITMRNQQVVLLASRKKKELMRLLKLND